MTATSNTNTTATATPKTNYKTIKATKSLLAYCGQASIGRFCSPMRSDSNPSFSLFHGSECDLWKDHGTGEAGDIIQLHIKINGCSFGQACQFLAGWDGITPIINLVGPAGTTVDNGKKYVLPSLNQPASCSAYITNFGFTLPEWVVEQLDMRADAKGGLYYRMSNKVFHARLPVGEGKYMAKNCGATTYSACGHRHGNMYVYEGIGDFLGWINTKRDLLAGNDIHVILNSVTNVDKFLNDCKHFKKTVYMCLDNDKAGHEAAAKIMAAMPDLDVVDCSGEYKDYKDSKEYFLSLSN